MTSEPQDVLLTMPTEGEYHLLLFRNPEGETAYVDFEGDEIIYGGDLSFNESAKLFIESLHGFWMKAIERGIKEKSQIKKEDDEN